MRGNSFVLGKLEVVGMTYQPSRKPGALAQQG